MNLYVQSKWIDATRHCGLGDSDIYESFTDNRGELFRAMRHEYGRCISRIYIEEKDGSTPAIGWVFQKRCRYTDTGGLYLAETLVTVHEQLPTRTCEYHYARV